MGGAAVSELGVVTWNARALLTLNPRKRSAKLAYLRNLTNHHSVLLLQEVHGSTEEIKMFLAEYKRHWHILLNPGPDRGTGAVVTLIKKALFSADALTSTESYAPGRILRTQVHSVLAGRRYSAIVWNVHNFDTTLISERTRCGTPLRL